MKISDFFSRIGHQLVISAIFALTGIPGVQAGEKIWSPAENPTRIMESVRFAAAAMDGEEGGSGYLVLAERLGGKRPPYSSRLVFIDPNAGKVAMIAELEKIDLQKLFFYAPGKLGAISSDNSGNMRLGRINYNISDDSASFIPLGNVIRKDSKIALSGSNYFIAVRGDKNIINGNFESGNGGEKSIYCEIPNPEIFAPSPERLIAFSRNKTQKFNFDGEMFIPGRVENGGITLPRDAGKIVPFDPEGENFFCYEPEGPLYFYDRGEFLTLMDPLAAEAFALFPDKKDAAPEKKSAVNKRRRRPAETEIKSGDGEKSRLLAVAGAKLNTMNFYELPDSVKPVSSIRMKRLKPYDTGETRYLFASDGESVIAVDHRGQVMRVDSGYGKKWRKELLYSPDAR